MIFFVAMPFVIGLMNLVVPLQLGVRDVAFPTLNSVGFWLTATGALLVNVSLVVGEFARTGWLPYPPLSELTYSPGVGVDYYLWSLEISGVGTLVAGIDLVTAVLKIPHQGHDLYAHADVLLDHAGVEPPHRRGVPDPHRDARDADPRPLSRLPFLHQRSRRQCRDVHEPDLGVGPSRRSTSWCCRRSGFISEVVATFSGKPLFGYRFMVLAALAICVMSFMVWLDHFFTMGAGPNLNAIFGIASMIIAVPTGVKIYNWLFAIFRRRIRFTTPMMWSIGFMVTFILGGLTGVLVPCRPRISC